MSKTNLNLIWLREKGVEAWNVCWNERNEKDEWPDLSGADLRGMDLTGINLFQAVLNGADLRDTILQNARLLHAKLNDADLRGTNLRAANLFHAEFRGAKLDDRTMFHETILDHADFMAAILNKVNFEACSLKRVHFIDAEMKGTILRWAAPAGASFVGADLTGADLSGSDFCGAVFCRDAKLLAEMRGSQTTTLKRCNLSHCKLHGVSFKELDLTGASLNHADLSESGLQGARITDVDFRDANLFKVKVAGVQYVRSRMRGNYLGIRGVETCIGNPVFQRDASDQDYLDSLQEKWQGSWRSALFFLWGLIDYGRSLSRVFLLAFLLVFGFGTVYKVCPDLVEGPTSIKSAFTPYYMSFKGFAFGDLKPNSIFGELAVSFESVSGYMTLGLLVSVLAEKVARRR